MECFYYTFGPDDAFVVAELPDEASAAAVALAVGAPGTATIRTTVIIDPETVDAAAQKAVNYRPPGG